MILYSKVRIQTLTRRYIAYLSSKNKDDSLLGHHVRTSYRPSLSDDRIEDRVKF